MMCVTYYGSQSDGTSVDYGLKHWKHKPIKVCDPVSCYVRYFVILPTEEANTLRQIVADSDPKERLAECQSTYGSRSDAM